MPRFKVTNHAVRRFAERVLDIDPGILFASDHSLSEAKKKIRKRVKKSRLVVHESRRLGSGDERRHREAIFVIKNNAVITVTRVPDGSCDPGRWNGEWAPSQRERMRRRKRGLLDVT